MLTKFTSLHNQKEFMGEGGNDINIYRHLYKMFVEKLFA